MAIKHTRAHRWYADRTVKPGRPGCPGGRVLRAFRSDRSFPYNTPTTPNPQHATIGIRKEVGVLFGKYYASTQSRARTPAERSVVTCRTAPSSPERSCHRRRRSSPKFSLRWLAA
jgi:hypothetical protein